MYSDWEKRSDVEVGAKENVVADTLGEHQARNLQQPLTELTFGTFNASMVNTSSNGYLQIDIH